MHYFPLTLYSFVDYRPSDALADELLLLLASRRREWRETGLQRYVEGFEGVAGFARHQHYHIRRGEENARALLKLIEQRMTIAKDEAEAVRQRKHRRF